METFWMCVVATFAAVGVFAVFGGIYVFFEDRKEKKRGNQARTKLLVERVERLELDRKNLILDTKSIVQKVEHSVDGLSRVLELLEKKAVLKESRYIRKPRSYGVGVCYGVLNDLVSEEEAVTQMQEQREKAVRDGFTLAHTHQDGSETWVKKDKEKK